MVSVVQISAFRSTVPRLWQADMPEKIRRDLLAGNLQRLGIVPLDQHKDEHNVRLLHGRFDNALCAQNFDSDLVCQP